LTDALEARIVPIYTCRKGLLVVTRDDVARRAQTSSAVVSYVVNGGPRPVAEPTRARVEEAIRALGYRPNRVARALRTSSTNVLGVVLPDIANSFFSELARAIEDAALEAGYALFIGSSEQNVERQSMYLKAFAEHQVEGLLVIAASDEEHAYLRDQRAGLPASSVPLVVVDRLPKGLRASSVTVENEDGGYRATKHLLEHGHRYVHCLSGPQSLSSVQDRIAGWRRAMQETRRGGTQRELVSCAFSRSAAATATAELLAARRRPTALFVHSDEQAMGVLAACRRAGLDVPQDVAVVSFDGTRERHSTWPVLSTMGQPIRELGECAVRALLQQLREKKPPRSSVLPVRFLAGGSCGCPTEVAA
jgi:LacI family transcriptional regulator